MNKRFNQVRTAIAGGLLSLGAAAHAAVPAAVTTALEEIQEDAMAVATVVLVAVVAIYAMKFIRKGL